jgi:hypothetical protein
MKHGRELWMNIGISGRVCHGRVHRIFRIKSTSGQGLTISNGCQMNHTNVIIFDDKNLWFYIRQVLCPFNNF